MPAESDRAPVADESVGGHRARAHRSPLRPPPPRRHHPQSGGLAPQPPLPHRRTARTPVAPVRRAAKFKSTRQVMGCMLTSRRGRRRTSQLPDEPESGDIHRRHRSQHEDGGAEDAEARTHTIRFPAIPVAEATRSPRTMIFHPVAVVRYARSARAARQRPSRPTGRRRR